MLCLAVVLLTLFDHTFLSVLSLTYCGKNLDSQRCLECIGARRNFSRAKRAKSLECFDRERHIASSFSNSKVEGQLPQVAAPLRLCF